MYTFIYTYNITRNLIFISETIKPKITDNAELVHQEVPSTFIYGLLPNTSYIINIKANTISQKALYSLRVVGTTKPASM